MPETSSQLQILRSHLVLPIVALLLIVIAYGGTYSWLRARGQRDANLFESEGFYYVPAPQIGTREGMKRHKRLTLFFAPANWIDRTLFDGPVSGAEPLQGLN
jgi:hypothetical protein